MATKPSLAIFTGSKTLGQVISEQHQLNVRYTDFNVPFTTESGNTAIQWKGKTRTIVVQGTHDGTGFDGASSELKLKDFIAEIEEWINGTGETGNIQASTVYTNSFGTTYNVNCFDWTWSRSFSDPSRIIYSLLFKRV